MSSDGQDPPSPTAGSLSPTAPRIKQKGLSFRKLRSSPRPPRFRAEEDSPPDVQHLPLPGCQRSTTAPRGLSVHRDQNPVNTYSPQLIKKTTDGVIREVLSDPLDSKTMRALIRSASPSGFSIREKRKKLKPVQLFRNLPLGLQAYILTFLDDFIDLFLSFQLICVKSSFPSKLSQLNQKDHNLFHPPKLSHRIFRAYASQFANTSTQDQNYLSSGSPYITLSAPKVASIKKTTAREVVDKTINHNTPKVTTPLVLLFDEFRFIKFVESLNEIEVQLDCPPKKKLKKESIDIIIEKLCNWYCRVLASCQTTCSKIQSLSSPKSRSVSPPFWIDMRIATAGRSSYLGYPTIKNLLKAASVNLRTLSILSISNRHMCAQVIPREETSCRRAATSMSAFPRSKSVSPQKRLTGSQSTLPRLTTYMSITDEGNFRQLASSEYKIRGTSLQKRLFRNSPSPVVLKQQDQKSFLPHSQLRLMPAHGCQVCDHYDDIVRCSKWYSATDTITTQQFTSIQCLEIIGDEAVAWCGAMRDIKMDRLQHLCLQTWTPLCSSDRIVRGGSRPPVGSSGEILAMFMDFLTNTCACLKSLRIVLPPFFDGSSQLLPCVIRYAMQLSHRTLETLDFSQTNESLDFIANEIADAVQMFTAVKRAKADPDTEIVSPVDSEGRNRPLLEESSGNEPSDTRQSSYQPNGSSNSRVAQPARQVHATANVVGPDQLVDMHPAEQEFDKLKISPAVSENLRVKYSDSEKLRCLYSIQRSALYILTVLNGVSRVMETLTENGDAGLDNELVRSFQNLKRVRCFPELEEFVNLITNSLIRINKVPGFHFFSPGAGLEAQLQSPCSFNPLPPRRPGCSNSSNGFVNDQVSFVLPTSFSCGLALISQRVHKSELLTSECLREQPSSEHGSNSPALLFGESREFTFDSRLFGPMWIISTSWNSIFTIFPNSKVEMPLFLSVCPLIVSSNN